MILGLGTDLVSVTRVESVLSRHPLRFAKKVLTEKELVRFQALDAPGMAAAHIAKQFAAKEAVSKALGTGMRQGVHFNLIEVTRSPSGQPMVSLIGGALAVAQQLQVRSWHLSLTDDSGFVVAVAIAEG